jgi:tRNA uridine 5-carbamoylmethylation protein Kti12
MGIIVETKDHYEVLCILNYVNSKYNTKHTKHDFGGSRVKFVHIAPDGNVSYIRTFKAAVKIGKVIQTFPMFVNSIIAENNDLQLQIDNLHKELRDSFNKLAKAEAENESRFKTIFKL